MNGTKAITLVGLLLTLIGGGTVFFRHVEGWSWLDSYFFTVVTLSTVGYGELVPATPMGKIGTTVFIILGLGIFAIAIQQFGNFAVRRHEIRKSLREERAKHRKWPGEDGPHGKADSESPGQ
ncbi:MAG: potassium channel family protein [Roseovarius pacificus]|nr:potassium channel family protein [Roseovarius pacificus]